MSCSDPFQMSTPCLSPNPDNYSFFGLVSRKHLMKTSIQNFNNIDVLRLFLQGYFVQNNWH